MFYVKNVPNWERILRIVMGLMALGYAAMSWGAPLAVGAGVMGGDIAAWCALRGMGVTLQDLDIERIKPALTRAKSLFKKRLKSKTEIDNAVARLEAEVAQLESRLLAAPAPIRAQTLPVPAVPHWPAAGDVATLWTGLQPRLQAQGLQLLSMRPQAITAFKDLPEQSVLLRLQGRWDDWLALASACETHGVGTLFRSDHYLSVDDRRERGSLDAWGTISALSARSSSVVRMRTMPGMRRRSGRRVGRLVRRSQVALDINKLNNCLFGFHY